jgi:uncharacterized protein (TIGR02147 family)
LAATSQINPNFVGALHVSRMTAPNMKRIYAYQDPRDFLREQFDYRRQVEPSFSVRKWAKDMGLKGPKLLAGLLSGSKRFRPRYTEFLKKGLCLDAMEELYFETMILRKNSKDAEETSVLDRLLQNLSPGEEIQTRVSNDENVFSDWTAMALLSALEISELRSEKDLLKAFSEKLSSDKFYTLIKMLKEKGLLSEDNDGLKPNQQRLLSSTDQLNLGSHHYYEEVLDLAKCAISTNLVQREFQFFSVTISSEDIPAYKDMIRSLRTKMESRGLHSTRPDSVYQMSIQFFPLVTVERPKLRDKFIFQEPVAQGL